MPGVYAVVVTAIPDPTKTLTAKARIGTLFPAPDVLGAATVASSESSQGASGS